MDASLDLAPEPRRGPGDKRIGVLIVAYNASATLAKVLDRIPQDFRSRVSDVLICDNASPDATYLVGLGYQHVDDSLPITVVRHPRNLGYGGNQKAGYRWAIDHGLDIVVLLHADGQYAPEFLPQIVEPLEKGEADAVFGSRMMTRGGARSGGMPLYKFVGNRILTTFENAMAGLELSEWHSGYRAYTVETLRQVPFEDNTDEYDFDTQIILQLHEAGKRIVELPIPTYYGDEISYVNGLRYAKDIVADVMRYRAHKMGLGSGETAFASEAYEVKEGDETSHGRVLAWLSGRPPARVLELGCSDGGLGERLRRLGHHVTGVEVEERGDVRQRLDGFVVADLDDGVPDEVGTGYDVVLAVDVLARVRRPEKLLADARRCLRPGGSLLAGVANFGHWYPRLRVLSGLFDYDRRGILDRSHVRFFTRRTFERLVAESGWAVRRREAVGPPLEVVHRGRSASMGRTGRALQWVNGLGVGLRPTLFAYQFLYDLQP